MESTNMNEAKVGLFVSIGAALLIASVLLVGGDRYFLTSYYTLNVRFNQVQGITQGSVVSLAGIRVGNVKEISFNREAGSIDLKLDIDESFRDRITKSSMASVQTQGALGDKFIYIAPGNLSDTPLEPDAFMQTEMGTDIMSLIKEKGPGMIKIVDVIEELHIFLARLNNEGRSASMLANLHESSESLKVLLKETSLIVKEVRGTSKETNSIRTTLLNLSSILKKIDDGQGSLGALINDPVLHKKLVGLLGESPRNKFLKPLIRDTIKVQDK